MNLNMVKFMYTEYGLSEEQAEAILAISFRRLTALEVPFYSIQSSSFFEIETCNLEDVLTRFYLHQRKKFTDESSSLTEQITKLEQLLSSRTNILKVTNILILVP